MCVFLLGCLVACGEDTTDGEPIAAMCEPARSVHMGAERKWAALGRVLSPVCVLSSSREEPVTEKKSL